MAAESGVGWGTKSVGNLEWWFARISSFFSPFLVLRFPPCHEIFSNARLMFILFHHDDVIGDLNVGYIGIAESVVFSRWAILRDMRSTNTGLYRSASIYWWGGGGFGGRHTDFLRWFSQMGFQG